VPRTSQALLTALLLVVSFGCHLPGPTMKTAPAAWVERNGGLATGPALDRARLAAERVGSDQRLDVSVAVLASATPAAYSWPSGEVFVTRGLIDSFEEEHLAAAIAHEVGHLIDGGHLEDGENPGELAGRGDPETRADRVGMQILESRGIPSLAMVRMLEALRSRAGPRTEVGRALTRRIAALVAVEPAERGAPGPR
jgi:Zn-dependent protease with chaperone function